MERRDFLKSCVAACAAGSVLAIALQSCKTAFVATSTLENNQLKVKKSEFTDENAQTRAFVVLRSEKLNFPIAVYKSNETYTALSTQCTHSGCEIQPNKVSLVCPCHGSEFSNTGKVLNPPAERELKQYTITTDTDYFYVQL